jgi:DNA-nicking Smr family endonuclease
MSEKEFSYKLQSDAEGFASMLEEGVVPHSGKGAHIAPTATKQTPGMVERRKAAQLDDQSGGNMLDSGANIKQLDPFDELSYVRPGVQHGVYKNLRLGKYDIQSSLDLHGRTVDQARQDVWRFLEDGFAQGIRCCLITHGKGQGREEPAKIKSCVNHWLSHFSYVLAFHTAQKMHGGLGATYVLLSKSVASKQKTARQHQHRANKY